MSRKFNKAALVSGDLTGTYSLTRDTEGRFWDKVMNQSNLLALTPTRLTDAAFVYSNELTLGANAEDILRPGVVGVDPGDTVTVADAQRTFVPEEVIAIAQVSDNLLEDNIEGDAFWDHLLSMVQIAWANSLENALLNGSIANTANVNRGSVTGCFDGWLEQINDGGNIVHATVTFSDRKPSITAANDKHLAATKLLPNKYQLIRPVFLSPRTIVADMANLLANRLTPLGDQYIGRGFQMGVQYLGVPFLEVPKLRTNHLVKGTGVVGATTPGDTTVTLAKARATAFTVASIANFANAQSIVLGCDAAGTSYELHAELRTQSGTPSGTTLTVSVALTYDHATGEIVTEYTTAPTITGISNVYCELGNLWTVIQRGTKIELFREPRKRVTSMILTARLVPIVQNPDAAVIIRDLLPIT